jgi:hypothetical protein
VRFRTEYLEEAMNVRTKGMPKDRFKARLAEIDDDFLAEDQDDNEGVAEDIVAAQREITWLRKEVADLQERLAAIHHHGQITVPAPEPMHPWLRIGVTVASTWVLCSLVQKLRLGTPGAAAVPMMVVRMDAARLKERL